MKLKFNCHLSSRLALLALSAACALLTNTSANADTEKKSISVSNPPLSNINHIVVIYQENWPFDGLYGSFPGADGIPGSVPAQVDRLTGATVASLSSFNNAALTGVGTVNPPPPLTADSNNSGYDSHFPSNGTLNTLVPYSLSSFINPTITTGDIYHRYWQEQYQIYGTVTMANGSDSEAGNKAGFVTWSDNPGLVMSHFDATNLPEGILAQQYTICDHFYHSAFGGSFLNHQFLIAGAAPVYDSMPTSNNGNIAFLDANGAFVMNTSGTKAGKYAQDGSITPVAGDLLSPTYNGSTISVTVANGASQGSTQAYGFANDAAHQFTKHYVVNTTRSANLPSGTDAYPAVSLLPTLNDSDSASGTRTFAPNIGDVLSHANISWKWYSGGWAMIAGYSKANTGTNPLYPALPASGYSAANGQYAFQYHHQPFAYYDNTAPFGTATVPATYVGGFAGALPPGVTAGQSGISINQATNSAAHLQDETSFFSDVQNGTLPSVCFIKPVGINNEHPGYAALQTGQNHVASIVQAVQANPTLWAHTAIIITYDEHGGRWDHESVPVNDIWGPGQRVPCIVISPYAQRGHVESTVYDTSSILKTIEERFTPTSNIAALGGSTSRDTAATGMDAIFTNTQITRGGIVYNHTMNRFTQQVTVTNLGTQALSGPVYLRLANPTSTVTNATGHTTSADTTVPTNTPYFTLTSGSIAAGASITVTVHFVVPTSGGITYTPSVATGATP